MKNSGMIRAESDEKLRTHLCGSQQDKNTGWLWVIATVMADRILGWVWVDKKNFNRTIKLIADRVFFDAWVTGNMNLLIFPELDTVVKKK